MFLASSHGRAYPILTACCILYGRHTAVRLSNDLLAGSTEVDPVVADRGSDQLWLWQRYEFEHTFLRTVGSAIIPQLARVLLSLTRVLRVLLLAAGGLVVALYCSVCLCPYCPAITASNIGRRNGVGRRRILHMGPSCRYPRCEVAAHRPRRTRPQFRHQQPSYRLRSGSYGDARLQHGQETVGNTQALAE